MSASEKLKALDGALLPAPWEAWGGTAGEFNDPATGGLTVGPDYDPNGRYVGEGRIKGGIDLNTDALVALRHALPQIVAVVEAAEGFLLDDGKGDPKRVRSWAEMDAALTALERVLDGE